MRKLSYASDSFNAFTGLANAMQEFRPSIYNVAGIPFMVGNKRIDRDYWAESLFSSGLAWFSIQGMDRSDQKDAENAGFPSWSWGNVKLWPVELDYLSFFKGRGIPKAPRKESKLYAVKHRTRLRDIKIEFAADGEKQVTGLAEYADKTRKAIKTRMSLAQPKALIFKARFVPSHAICLRSGDDDIDKDDSTLYSGQFCHDAHGTSKEFKINIVEDTFDETNRYPQVDLQIPFYDSRRYRLILHDKNFYHEMIASRWSLLLLRCFAKPNTVQLLVIKGVEGKTASRVGTIFVRPESRLFEDDGISVAGEILGCFTDEREVRLV